MIFELLFNNDVMLEIIVKLNIGRRLKYCGYKRA